MPLGDRELKIVKANRGIAHSRLVTLLIPPNNTRSIIYFDDQPDLRYARILGMEVVLSNDFRRSRPLAATCINVNQMRYVGVSLETNNPDIWNDNFPAADNSLDTGRFRDTSLNLKWQPLVTFHRIPIMTQNFVASPGVKDLLEFNNTFVTWSKSFVTLSDPGQLSGQFFCICFNVYYTYRSINGKLIPRK